MREQCLCFPNQNVKNDNILNVLHSLTSHSSSWLSSNAVSAFSEVLFSQALHKHASDQGKFIFLQEHLLLLQPALQLQIISSLTSIGMATLFETVN